MLVFGACIVFQGLVDVSDGFQMQHAKSIHLQRADSLFESMRQRPSTKLFVSEMEKTEIGSGTSTIIPEEHQNNDILIKKGKGVQVLDSSTYEAYLLKSWDEDVSLQKGFDWEIEKLRRFSAGLYQLPDGTWAKRKSIFNFLVSPKQTKLSPTLSDSPQPVNPVDVIVLVITNILTSLGFGPALGMAAVPDAVIQKYEGSFFSFITGVLGGDLQTLAGGPLFLLLAKYYKDYGPIFNLSFGPKSFLVVSDPVMAKHILRETPVDQYCKGMLAEILEPIMGKGLIPADPQTWKVSWLTCFSCVCAGFNFV